MTLIRIITERAPAAAERVVVIATLPARLAALAEIMRVEPQLKPYQPNQRMKVPRAHMVEEEPGMSWGCLVTVSKRPIRGPRMMAPTRPATPPVMWTMPEPAKSIMPLEAEVPERRGR